VLQQLGTPWEVYNRPANTFVAGFMGSPRMNLVKARLEARGGAFALEFREGERASVQMDLSSELVPSALAGYVGREVTVGLRPEAVSLCSNGMAAGPKQCIVEAQVEVIEPTGADTLAVVDLGGHEFTVRLEPDVQLSPGDNVRFVVDLAKLVCFDPPSGNRIN